MNIFVNFIRICFWGLVFLVAFSITEDPSSPGLTTFHLLKAVAVTSVAIIPLVLGKDVPVLGGICQFLLSWGWEPKVVYDIPKDKKDNSGLDQYQFPPAPAAFKQGEAPINYPIFFAVRSAMPMDLCSASWHPGETAMSPPGPHAMR